MEKRRKDMAKLYEVMALIINGQPLPPVRRTSALRQLERTPRVPYHQLLQAL
jgi:mRNA-degrading endonuclease YafQ of YafQ-DinJ toxin-antitoxin module